MVKDICIDRQCEFKIVTKQGLVLLLIACEFISNLNELEMATKFVSTNVSIVNNMDRGGPQISKIGGLGKTYEEAYADFVKVFNRNRNYYSKENKILLCCSEIPKLEMSDLRDFEMTRIIRFSTEKVEEKKHVILDAYVRKQNDKLIFTYDGVEDSYFAETDKEIIEHILSNCSFDESPQKTNRRRRGRLFYPTTEEFIR